MNSNVIKLLLVLSTVMLIVFLIEWHFSTSSEGLLQDLEATKKQRQIQPRELPDIELSKQSAETYTEMIEKPLFIKGRQPVDDIEEIVSIEDGKIEDLVLVGIYTIKNQLMALFIQSKSDKKHIKKLAGEDVSGWLLQEITADSAILQRDGRQQTLMLRKPKPKQLKKTKPARRNTLKRPKLNPEK